MKLPSGGPLNLSQRVAETFLAHIERLCAAIDTREYNDAQRKRIALLADLSDDDRRHVSFVCAALWRP